MALGRGAGPRAPPPSGAVVRLLAPPAGHASERPWLLVPVVDLEVVWRRPAPAIFGQRPETQQERCPLHAAMRGEFDRFAPVPVTEHHDCILALPRHVKGHVW